MNKQTSLRKTDGTLQGIDFVAIHRFLFVVECPIVKLRNKGDFYHGFKKR